MKPFWTDCPSPAPPSGGFCMRWMGMIALFLLLGSGLQAQVPADSLPANPDSNRTTIDETGRTRTIEQLKVRTDTIAPEGIIVKQEELTEAESKMLRKEKLPSRRQQRREGLLPPDPQVAVRRSMVLPGWGQAYNRSYWKIPLIYAGFGTFAFFVADNHTQYKYHSNAVKCIQTTGCTEYPEFDGLPVENVISTRDFHRRFRDLNIIFAGLWYLLQSIDAYTEAHLKEFDVSDDLSLRLRPSMVTDPFQTHPQVYMGATLSIRLKK